MNPIIHQPETRQDDSMEDEQDEDGAESDELDDGEEDEDRGDSDDDMTLAQLQNDAKLEAIVLRDNLKQPPNPKKRRCLGSEEGS